MDPEHLRRKGVRKRIKNYRPICRLSSFFEVFFWERIARAQTREKATLSKGLAENFPRGIRSSSYRTEQARDGPTRSLGLSPSQAPLLAIGESCCYRR